MNLRNQEDSSLNPKPKIYKMCGLDYILQSLGNINFLTYKYTNLEKYSPNLKPEPKLAHNEHLVMVATLPGPSS
jgi:hypothetical protein